MRGIGRIYQLGSAEGVPWQLSATTGGDSGSPLNGGGGLPGYTTESLTVD
jgi:hypothetical protein